MIEHPPAASARESQFPQPTMACRECGRTDEHTYCYPWLSGLTLLMVLIAGAGCVTMFLIGVLYGR